LRDDKEVSRRDIPQTASPHQAHVLTFRIVCPFAISPTVQNLLEAVFDELIMQMQSSQLPSQGQPSQQQQAQRGYYMAAAAGANLRPTQQGVAGTASYAAGLQGRRTNRTFRFTSSTYIQPC